MSTRIYYSELLDRVQVSPEDVNAVLAAAGDGKDGAQTAIDTITTLLHAIHSPGPDGADVTGLVVAEASWAIALLNDLAKALGKLEDRLQRQPAA